MMRHVLSLILLLLGQQSVYWT